MYCYPVHTRTNPLASQFPLLAATQEKKRKKKERNLEVSNLSCPLPFSSSTNIEPSVRIPAQSISHPFRSFRLLRRGTAALLPRLSRHRCGIDVRHHPYCYPVHTRTDPLASQFSPLAATQEKEKKPRSLQRSVPLPFPSSTNINKY
jgi:hypothetical protein